jgi:hypothetical protein
MEISLLIAFKSKIRINPLLWWWTMAFVAFVSMGERNSLLFLSFAPYCAV